MITLIHPSRQRSEKAFNTYSEWLVKSSAEHEIEHILSLDMDDPQLTTYQYVFGKPLINNNDCVVKATNRAAKLAKGDIFVYLSDDFQCPTDWDKLIVDALDINKPCLLKVDDCLQRFKTDIVTIPIMTKALYEKLGYFFHPEYRSMFCDQDLYWVCKNNGWLIEREDLKFEHHHYCNKKAVKDETYTRSEGNWNQGVEVYSMRKLLDFPL